MSMEKNYDIIRAPVITEKATLLSESSQVVFQSFQPPRRVRNGITK